MLLQLLKLVAMLLQLATLLLQLATLLLQVAIKAEALIHVAKEHCDQDRNDDGILERLSKQFTSVETHHINYNINHTLINHC